MPGKGQTDFTYFKIIGWGWYYLSTILDDYVLYDNGDKESANAMIPIIQQAQRLISELNSDLDSVNRDKLQLPNVHGSPQARRQSFPR